MAEQLQKFGVIGLGVMGQSIALNIERNCFPVAVYNRTRKITEEFMEDERVKDKGRNIKPAFDLEKFVHLLERPRKILIIVKDGKPVDDVIEQLTPWLNKGDIIIDGGNSLYKDTERRTSELERKGIRFVGMGVSGGEEGALNGPSLMPGGWESAYEELFPILTKIAAQVDDGPCVTYCGPRGAGHYVKMVHNGIEYGDMQLIAEAYHLMESVAGLDHKQLAEVFDEWNKTDELNSFLIEITADIFDYIDEETGKPLVELIKDAAGNKGTGRWTVQDALDLGVTIPTIVEALNARIISSYKDQRVDASKELSGPNGKYEGDTKKFIDMVRDALYCSKICSYAQGMVLLSEASDKLKYNINLGEIARIWKGGCIIRAGFLDKIKKAFDENPSLSNLLLAPEFKQTILDRQDAWREVIITATKLGIPVPVLSASLNYFDSYRTERLPQNLTQAQRDYFGAHTYERIDKEGVFHTEWTEIKENERPSCDE